MFVFLSITLYQITCLFLLNKIVPVIFFTNTIYNTTFICRNRYLFIIKIFKCENFKTFKIKLSFLLLTCYYNYEEYNVEGNSYVLLLGDFMVNIYTMKNNICERGENLVNDCWIDIVSPTYEELEEIASKTLTDEALLTKLLDKEELPRIETSGTATLIVIDTPYVVDAKDKGRHKYNTEPLGIIVNNGYFITISLKEQELLEDFKLGKVRDFSIAKKTRFIIQILLKTASFYQKELMAINEDINSKEASLYKSTDNKKLLYLLNIERTLVYFSTSLKANDVVLEKLAKGNILALYEADVDLLDDALIENKQAIEMATIYREILTSMTDTYATIISNNLNDIMKFLAGITIVFSIPTMVASFMGMNVYLGDLGKSPFSFILIIIFSFVLSAVIALILKRKNML